MPKRIRMPKRGAVLAGLVGFGLWIGCGAGAFRLALVGWIVMGWFGTRPT